MSTISITIPNSLNEFLENLCKTQGMDKSYFVKKALANLREDYEDMQIIEETIKNKESRLSLAEVEELLNKNDI